MNAYIKGYLTGYILKELKEQQPIRLNSYRYEDQKKEKADFVVKNGIVDTEYFSEELLQILHNLTELEYQLIILKYQKQYDDEEIAKILNLPLSKIKQINRNILEQLRKQDDIKLLLKK